MKLKKLLSIVLAVALSASVFCVSIMNTNADTTENPNPDAEITGVQAIRNSLNLVWNDEFGGDIGCGAEKQALATTNGFDENGNPTSDEVRANAKWAHERKPETGNGKGGEPFTRNGQIQLYVGEDGRNSWTEDGVLHLRGQREEGEGYTDPITGKKYRWTADGLNSSYFDDDGAHFQAFRFGMMEARIYTVNGAALKDENGDVVLDRDGNVQQDPATSQGLWNGFWTCGNADMSDEAAEFIDHDVNWPYTGEIDICEAMNNHTDFRTYDYTNKCTLKDENGLVFGYNFSSGKYTYLIKHDENGKTLITTNDGTVCVSYDSDNNTYIVGDDYTGTFTVENDTDGTPYIVLTREKTTSYTRYFDIKQETNSEGVLSNCVIERKVSNSTGVVSVNKTLVDTEGNCYGSANMSTAQYHHDQGTRIKADGTKETVAGATGTGKVTKLHAGFSANESTNPGNVMTGDTGYHTYGIYWTPTQFVYYVDDTITGCFDITSPEYFALRECPQYAILTFPIGGDVPGAPNPALQYAEYLVDYVRIYQADDSAYGNTGDLDYNGSKGFPTLNELDKGYDTENDCIDMSYYQPIIDAYSHINVIEMSKSNVELTANNSGLAGWGAAPLLTSQNVAQIASSNATITTKKKLSEGKYDVYLQGLSRYYGKNYKVTLNGSDIGAELQMYSANKLYTDTEKYPNFTNKYYLYGSADAYLGTAEIVNGEHNLTMSLTQSYRPNDDANTVINGGIVRALIAVKSNNSNTTTVTIGEDSPVATTTTTTTTQSGETSSTTTTTTATNDEPEGFYQITDVSTTANWQSGWWNSDNGAFGDWTGIGNRAAMKKKVQVEYGTEYTLNLKNATGGLKYVLREYDSNGSFLKSFGTVELGATYTPSSESVGFVSLTVYDTANSQDPYTLISSGTIVPSMTIISSETSKNFVFSDTYADLSDNTADFKFDTSMAYPCVHSEWNKDLTAGTGVTITTKETVEPGIYDVTLFTRDASPRALIDISINGVVVAQSLDTTSSSIIANNSYKLKTISIPASTVLTIKVTVAESGKNVYLNSLTLTKTADYTTELTSAVATEASASIRLNEQNGIRFYTTVDEEALEALTSGVDYEIGTIVAPANALGSYGELTHEIGDANYAEIKYEVRTADGKIEYFNAENKEIVGSLVNIKDSNISREFMARAYVKVGETYYYSTTTSTRSLQTVATALQNDSSDTAQTLYQNHKAMVDAWAAGKAYN